MRRYRFILPMALAVCASVFASSANAGSLPPAVVTADVATISKQVLSFLDGYGEIGVDVGQIVPFGNSPENGVAGLRAALIDSLETQRHGVVQKRARLAINGKYGAVNDPQDSGSPHEERQLALRLTVEILDKTSGAILLVAETFLRRQQEIARIVGATVRLPEGSAREQNIALKRMIESPRVFLSGSRIRSAPDSPYEIEIAARAPNAPRATPRTARDEAGEAFVDIQKSELYEVIVRNNSDKEISAAITIDGIDMFAFSDDLDLTSGKPRYSSWIIAPGGTLVVPGWHKTNNPTRSDNFLSFLVTEYGKGASSKFAGETKGPVGVITVSIAQSHVVGSTRAKASAETGFGPPQKGNLAPVVRLVDPPHEYISVRYAR